MAPSKARCGSVAAGVLGVSRQLKFSAAEPLTVAMTRSPVKGRYFCAVLAQVGYREERLA